MKHTLVFHTIDLAKKLQKVINFKASPINLSYSQACTLLVIGTEHQLSQTRISQKLHLEPASVVTLIDELEKLDLVKRQSANGDRRKYHITQTPKGKIKTLLITKKIDSLEKFLQQSLPKGKITNYIKVLESLTASLETWKEVKNEIPSPKRPLATRTYYQGKTGNW